MRRDHKELAMSHPKTQHPKTTGGARTIRVGRFGPLKSLWSGDSPFFPSEQSARWALRTQKHSLIEAEALALHRGRLMVDAERAAQVIERNAINAVKAKLGQPV
jgi:hypothetical protein